MSQTKFLVNTTDDSVSLSLKHVPLTGELNHIAALLLAYMVSLGGDLEKIVAEAKITEME